MDKETPSKLSNFSEVLNLILSSKQKALKQVSSKLIKLSWKYHV